MNFAVPVVKCASGGFCSFLNQVFGNPKNVSGIYIHCPKTGKRIDNFADYVEMMKLWSTLVENKDYSTSCDHVTIVVVYLDGTTIIHLGLDNSARANEFTSPLTKRNDLGIILEKLIEYYPTKLVISMQEAHRDIFEGPLKNNKQICSFEKFILPVFANLSIPFVNKGVYSPNENVVDGILIAFGIQVFCTQDIHETLELSSELIQGSPLVKIQFNGEFLHYIYHSPLDFANLKVENISDNRGLKALADLIPRLKEFVCVTDANLITEIANRAYEIIGNKYLLNPKVATFLSAYNENAPPGLENCSIDTHLESFAETFSVTSEFFIPK